MKYISIIQKKGLAYFLHAAKQELIKKIFVFWQKKLYRGKEIVSYSQYSEDLFLDRFFHYKDNGVYIDIGANNPSLLNNTKKFYDRGWVGVNIEPDKNNFKLFLMERLRDTNLNVGVGEKRSSMLFYNFIPDTNSTFSKETADKLIEEGATLVEVEPVAIIRLEDVFKLINKRRVDFISIDTEGFDMQVLRSNDWEKFRSDIICIEDESGYKYDKFFEARQYKKYCYNGLNSFFVDKNISKKST